MKTFFVHEGPRRTPFLSAKGREEHLLGLGQNMVVGHESYLISGLVLGAGVLFLTGFERDFAVFNGIEGIFSLLFA